jgi:hypothetical protein
VPCFQAERHREKEIGKKGEKVVFRELQKVLWSVRSWQKFSLETTPSSSGKWGAICGQHLVEAEESEGLYQMPGKESEEPSLRARKWGLNQGGKGRVHGNCWEDPWRAASRGQSQIPLT